MRTRNAVFLFLAAFIWGVAFVWQDMASDVIPTFTFTAIRFGIGALFLFVLSVIFDLIKRSDCGKKGLPVPEFSKKKLGKYIILGAVCGAVLCIMTVLQQFSFTDENMTSGKCGFLTALYILLVPVLRMFFKKFPSLNVWIAVAVAVVGLYFLCLFGETGVSWGDFFVIGCALMNAVHILIIDRYSPETDPIKLCCLQCFFVSLFSMPFALTLEHATIQNIVDAMLPILFCAILSSGIAYTLQIFGQVNANPTVASMIMSFESVFSVLAGAVVLGQILPVHQVVGCILIFIAVVLAQLPPFGEWGKKKTDPGP